MGSNWANWKQTVCKLIIHFLVSHFPNEFENDFLACAKHRSLFFICSSQNAYFIFSRNWILAGSGRFVWENDLKKRKYFHIWLMNKSWLSLNNIFTSWSAPFPLSSLSWFFLLWQVWTTRMKTLFLVHKSFWPPQNIEKLFEKSHLKCKPNYWFEKSHPHLLWLKWTSEL